MPSNPKLSESTVNDQAAVFAARFNGGYLKIYDGAQPETADTPITTQKLLASLRFGNPAFSKPSDGSLKANPITKDADAAATGKATWMRVLKSDGVTPIMDGTAGLYGCDLNMKSADIQQHAEVTCDSFAPTIRKA